MELTPEMKQVSTEIGAQIEAFKALAKADIEGLRQQIATATTKEELSNIKAQVEQMRAEFLKAVPGAGSEPEFKSLGGRVVDAPDLKEFAKTWRKGGAAIKFDSLFPPSLKTLIDSTALGSSTPGVLSADRIGTIVKPAIRRTRVRDLIPFTSTTMHAVEYLKENAFTSGASPQTEGSAKGESALTFTIAYANVITIATWIPVTRQALDDLSALSAYIDTRLMDGLADAEDYELLMGDGYGQNLNGIYTQATAVAGTYDDADDTMIDKVNNAMAELETYNYVADGLVVHPADWRNMNKIKTEEGGANKGMYVLGGPGQMPDLRIWDIPVVRTTAMTVGRFLVGQFRGSVQGFDRMQSQIDVSNSHSTFFTENKVAIRAEERITLAVFRPAAFRKGTY